MMKPTLILLLLLACFKSNYAQQATFDDTATQYSTGSWLDFIGIGDIDGDGLNDIAGATTFYFDTANDYYLWVWKQSANGQLQSASKFLYRPTDGTTTFAVSDLNDDRKAEIINVSVIRNKSTTFLDIYSWQNNGLKITDSIILSSASLTTSIATCDFDRDGLIDIGLNFASANKYCIIYQNSEGPLHWDIHYYTGLFNFVTSGKFGPLEQPALIGTVGSIIRVITFGSDRNQKDQYILNTLSTAGRISGASIVGKGADSASELWVTCYGNRPGSKINIWKGLQSAPDSSIDVWDCPEPIKSANLDCDDDDEPVIVHGAFNRYTVFTNTIDRHDFYTETHFKNESLALGDVNNDGRVDICIANGQRVNQLLIFYNTTPPCFPTITDKISSNDNTFTCYPNPVSELLNIKHGVGGELQITNVQGTLIYNGRFIHQTVINTSAWIKGMYFIKFLDDNGRPLYKKIMKY